MSANVALFNFRGHDIRSIVVETEPWFVGVDIANILEYKDPSGSVRQIVDEEDRSTTWIQSPSGQTGSKTTIINESGLYSLVLRSGRPKAKEFKRWVTAEVLPAIRKTGSYSVQKPPTHAEALRGWADEIDRNEVLTQQLEAARPAVEFVRHSVEEGESMSFGDAAKVLSLKTPDGRRIGRNLLKEGLRRMGVFLKQGKYEVPYQEHLNAGRFSVKYVNVEIGGIDVPVPTTYVRPPGLLWIRRKFINGGCSEA